MGTDSAREPKIYIITINWNQGEDTTKCLESLKALDYKNYEIILVDNGSIDGSPDRIAAKFPNVMLMRNKENLGFAGGNNVGIRYALSRGTDYIFLLNNDTKVDSGVLRELINVAEPDAKIGVVGAVNYSFEYPDKAITVCTSFNWFTGFTKKEPLEAISKGIISEPQEVHGVTGSSLLIKREVIERIGMLDERFFIYYEDTDWCVRARKAGFRVLYVPKAKIWHKISITFGEKSVKEYYLYTRNILLFMAKDCPKVFVPSFFLFYIIKNFVYSLKFIMTSKAEYAKAIFLGFVDFLSGNFGEGRLDQFVSIKRSI